MGNLISRRVSHLDAFSVYLVHTQLPSRAPGGTTGTPAITSRGFDEEDAKKTAGLIIEILSNPEDETTIEHVKQEVKELTQKHPIN